MSDETTEPQQDDTEGLVLRGKPALPVDDVEGHLVKGKPASPDSSSDDVEGHGLSSRHIQPIPSSSTPLTR